MFNLFGIFFFAVLGIIPKFIWGWVEVTSKCEWSHRAQEDACTQLTSYLNAPFIFSMVFCGVAIIWLFFAVIASSCEYMGMVERQQTLVRHLAKIKLAKKRWDTLAALLKEFLAKAYPELEKEIWAKLKPEDVQAYGAKFPELKSSATFKYLCASLHKIYDDYYTLCCELEDTKANIRYRVRDRWVLGSSFFPKLDEDKAKLPSEDMIS